MDHNLMYKKILFFENTPIFILLVICLAIGIFTLQDYGESWDEADTFSYAESSIQAYQQILHPQERQIFPEILNYYGPSYFMLALFFSGLITTLDPSLSIIDARHFIYFSTSLICVLFLYLLSRRWMSKWAAFGTALLFASQPLIWGHSFINPKDIPFTAFFLISIYTGFQMMDAPPKSKWKWVFTAGIIFGLTISIRIVGPLAGVFVFVYGLFKCPRELPATFPCYVLIAGLTTYMTWPYLWNAPISGFIESLKTMLHFPFTGPVLYMGNLYQPDQIPRRYYPTLLGLQLTEPALVLIAIGFMAALWGLIKGKNWEPFLLFAGWFLVPAFWIVLSRSALYDNARQLLFLWPPLFIMAGLGIDSLKNILKSPLFRAALLFVAALPGIFACIQLHPYEYVYYNSLTGGVRGAYRNYELDYWVTSFKESMEFLNANAEEGSIVMVVGSRQVARLYARSDITVVSPRKASVMEGQSYYLLSSTRTNQDQSHCGDSKILFIVERGGGVLSSIKKIIPGQNCK